LVKAVGINECQLPEIASPTRIAGTLLPQPASALNLNAGIPVVVGSGDDIEVIGNGLMQAGRSLEHLGTTGSILTCASSPVFDPQMGIELYPHAQPGLWVLGGSITTAGSAMAWASKLLGFEHVEDALATLANSISIDSAPLLFLPHLLGERSPAWDPHSRGAWIGLTTTHSSIDLMQACLEGIAFALKHILDSIESLVGLQEIITVSERQEESLGWLRLRGNVYGRPLGLIQTTEPTALGAMQLASVGIGLFKDLGEAVERTTRIERSINPTDSAVLAYEKNYERYRQIRSVMAEYWQFTSSAVG
jgi:xylulokinase